MASAENLFDEQALSRGVWQNFSIDEDLIELSNQDEQQLKILVEILRIVSEIRQNFRSMNHVKCNIKHLA